MARFRDFTPCLIVALLSVAAATTQADDTLRECSVYPLAVGTEWVYAMGPIELVERVEEHAMVGEELCARLETTYNGEVTAFEYVTVREDGVYRVSAMGETIEPAFCILKWPAQDGDSWEITSEVQGQSMSGQFNVSTSEVTVPAGEYETVHIESEDFVVTQADGTTLPLSFAFDFATGVGKVKQVAEIAGQGVTLELKEVTVPEP